MFLPSRNQINFSYTSTSQHAEQDVLAPQTTLIRIQESRHLLVPKECVHLREDCGAGYISLVVHGRAFFLTQELQPGSVLVLEAQYLDVCVKEELVVMYYLS